MCTLKGLGLKGSVSGLRVKCLRVSGNGCWGLGVCVQRCGNLQGGVAYGASPCAARSGRCLGFIGFKGVGVSGLGFKGLGV